MLATIAERFANGKLKTVRDAIQIDPLYAFSLDLSTPVRKCRNPLFFPGSTSMFFFFQGVSAVELEVHYLRGGLAHALLLPRETPHRYFFFFPAILLGGVLFFFFMRSGIRTGKDY